VIKPLEETKKNKQYPLNKYLSKSHGAKCAPAPVRLVDFAVAAAADQLDQLQVVRVSLMACVVLQRDGGGKYDV
jgi:hypothetical protein